MIPETRYARTRDGVSIAYQIFGDGPTQLVLAYRFVATIGYMWEVPEFARWLRALGRFATVLALDVRGSGLSDQRHVREGSALEDRVLDVLAVMDDAGWARASLFGVEDGGSLCALVAATHPSRVERLILYATYAKGVTTPDRPWGWPRETWDAFLDETAKGWTDNEWMRAQAGDIAPSHIQDEEFVRRLLMLYRLGARREAAVEAFRIQRNIDIEPVLPAIHVPTLILQRADDPNVESADAQLLESRIPNATFVELPGQDFEAFAGDPVALLDEIERFLTPETPHARSDRVLASLLMTDLVGSTEAAASTGDRTWKKRLLLYQDLAADLAHAHHGEMVDKAGDGLLMRFDGPAQAIKCCQAIMERAATLSLRLRGGVHIGEIELMEDQIAGLDVHITARIAALASADQILASSTVRDLVAGSGLVFDEHGEHQLKGVPDAWHIFAVDRGRIAM
jgi:class 3 adenylate cyclase